MWDAASSTRKKLNVTEMEFDLDPYVVDEMERVDRETSVNVSAKKNKIAFDQRDLFRFFNFSARLT